MKIDKEAVKAAGRTAGALIIGNSVVIPVLSKFENPYWWVLVLAGSVIIAITTISSGD